MPDLDAWLRTAWQSGNLLFAKRLSLNDTGATRSHQAGFYISKSLAFQLCPELDTQESDNPRHEWQAYIAQTGESREVSLIYYNSARTGSSAARGRNECRITGWGGTRWGNLFGPDSTGAIMMCAFNVANHQVSVWVGSTEAENRLLDETVGGLGPREEFSLLISTTSLLETPPRSALVYGAPKEWFAVMPSGIQIAEFVSKFVQANEGESIDDVLMRRVEEEYALFRALESAIYQPVAQHGFENIDSFLASARSMLNSRMSRAGRSLELAMRQALVEAGVAHTWQPDLSEPTTPDFIFPSAEQYLRSIDGSGITHLASKRTLRDRWRGVLREARKVPVKHLLTLDTNLTVPQAAEIAEAEVILVVPKSLTSKIPPVPGLKEKCISVADFIAQVR